MFEFILKPGADNCGNCDGMYIIDESKGNVNNKPVYVNHKRGTFLAAFGNTGWCITSLNYWEEVRTKKGAFGGFHSSQEKEPEDDGWSNFSVNMIDTFIFTSKAGQDNFANCDGTYICDSSKGFINDKPVYVNKEKDKFLAAHKGFGWCITSLGYWDEVKNKQGNFGGFHVGGEDQPHIGEWNQYTVKRHGNTLHSCSSEKLLESNKWHKYANKTVSYKAVANSGVIKTEADFRRARNQCIKLNCGGFAWRKPHYNQFGEEDDPPVCFFYRKNQCELTKALTPSDKFDFYIVCDEYSPDCSFKPNQDPAPSCHIRWEAGKSVHAFACQMQIPEASQYTYYMACGFHCGYSGIQQHCDDKQQLLFSVWDHPSASGRVTNTHVCSGMKAQPFGGEGKGMQALCISDCSCAGGSDLASWVPGEVYTFVIRAFNRQSGTEFACFFHKPKSGWREIARHLRPEPSNSEKGTLHGLYSFIEDWTGNSIRRSAIYSGWVMDTPSSSWRPVQHVKGTSTVDADYPNKCVELCSNESGSHWVKMTSGGDCLDNCELYEGKLNPPQVPECLLEL